MKLVLGASIGNCVHVAGVAHFLALAVQEGYETDLLGPATSIDALFKQIETRSPYMVGVSFRLTPENARPLLEEIVHRNSLLQNPPIWVFGGTPPVARVAKEFNLFKFISDGYDDARDSIRFLRQETHLDDTRNHGNDLIHRIKKAYPYPVLRHHFGLPNLENTITGVAEIAESSVLDVISLGPDQNAQQFFFHPNQMNPEFDGAGGVPVRTPEDFRRLKAASQRGNYPIMRCYSGTADVFRYAEMLVDTIDNAWTAVPLFWYSELDGRGTRGLEQTVSEAQRLIAWHAQRNMPVEINEPHHWGLRDAHDVISVATAYIAAYNAKKMGVKDYVAQYMFNTPNGLSFSMDFARILAMIEMVESLHDNSFTSYRETRAGLPLFAADPAVAKGQLAASTMMQMAVSPHIMHIVAYCEADHAATPAEVIESCKIAKGVIRHTVDDTPAFANTESVQYRKKHLVEEANYLLGHIIQSFPESSDPLADAPVLAECVFRGYLDAPHIVKHGRYKGTLSTTFKDGACVARHPNGKQEIDEATRLEMLDEKQHIDYGGRASGAGHDRTSVL